jgi:L-aminopeptidase/D-esterase-like protein
MSEKGSEPDVEPCPPECPRGAKSGPDSGDDLQPAIVALFSFRTWRSGHSRLEQNRIPGFGAERGSIICVLATDLPLAPGALERVARRAALGIARGGTPGGNSSGDIFLAFSTANPVDLPQVAGPWRSLTFLNDELLDTVYLAAVEAVDEAVLNAMLAAGDTPTATRTACAPSCVRWG